MVILFSQADPCNDQNQVWQGITCSSPANNCKLQSCEIMSLILDTLNLNGTLPAQFFMQLTSLTHLEISFSPSLVGSIPAEIGSLALLNTLFLDNNRLTGTIPSEIRFLTRLDSLYLHMN
jgi:hypothetical protein